jgi:protein TonB
MNLFETRVAGSQRGSWKPRILSLLIHLTLLLLACIPWAASPKPFPQGAVSVVLYTPQPLILPVTAKPGGGGGGRQSTTAPSLGRLPRAADRQLVPPSPYPPKNPDPALVIEPSIVAPQLASLPRLNLLNIGHPDGLSGPPSPGPGTEGGIGDGVGRGVGPNRGPSFGDGNDGGFTSFTVGGGVSAPVLISQVLPEYSEAARRARYQGTVVLRTIVRKDGTVEVVRIERGVGFGLDEKAVEAVLRWKFRPGRAGGEPVPVTVNIEVNFNLR